MKITEKDKIRAAKKKLLKAAENYKKLYPLLTKEKCQKLWGEEKKREKSAQDFLEIIQENLLTKLKAPTGEKIFPYLSGKTEQETLSSIKKIILETLERMATKGNSSHKLQSVFGPLSYQKIFAPGGFKVSKTLENHKKNFEDSLETFIKESTKLSPCHVVFSNEALSKKRYPKENYTTILEKGGPREKNAASFLKNQKLKLERILFGENYFLKASGENKNFFTSHFSSIREEDRDKKSDYFCEKRLNSLLESLKKNSSDKEFAFAGDINLYFFKDTAQGRILRDPCQKILQKFNLVLVLASGLSNKNIRPEIHEQWHKLKENSSNKAEVYPDSLIVLEPYDPSFDYEKLSHNSLGTKQDIFFPDGTKKIWAQEKIKEPFGEGFIMDHIPIRGQFVSILSGADADGEANPSKRFLDLEEQAQQTESFLLAHLEAMTINIHSTCDFTHKGVWLFFG